jgi:hypothetical protein
LANLHLILRRHVLQHFATRQAALALVFRQLIQLMQLLHQALLRRSRQPIEAGIVAEQALLILHRKTLMLIEPIA